MSTKITINGNTYKVPTAGEPAGWGEDTTDVILDLVTVVNALTGSDYIAESSAALDQSQSTLADVPALIFRKDFTKSATIRYVLDINMTVSSSSLMEMGHLNIAYDEGEATWKIQRDFSGDDSRIIFDITDNGQIQYKCIGGYAATVSSIVMSFKTESLVSIPV